MTNRGIKRLLAGLSAVVLTALAMSVPASATTTATLSFVAHQDDDLLFMNPDIAADIKAGREVWVTYLTAGELPCTPEFAGHCGMDYADTRIQGERAAYSTMAGVANDWQFEQMTFGGHPVAVNHLVGTQVHLVFTFIHAAAGPADNCGDLYRLITVPGFVAHPIDGRPGYTRAAFTGMLDAIIDHVDPDHIRTQSSVGHREPDPDNIDHVTGAILVAEADVDAAGTTRVRRDEYTGYQIRQLPDNVSPYWATAKRAAWDAYWPHDWNLYRGVTPGHRPWDNVMAKQYHPAGRVFTPGIPWIPPADVTC
ncbi:PIG-L family deacetylase [Actinokineospora globicatena]|uniref:PIG-L family deacetylase n=1 Tax=Actinokineospora globicatena TaxID=103729 RepID=UPI0020A45302|nr:PIG-L family deacetylase [Actinokineospora globicatena]MCP2306362.1 GlcNAc-PI de-N-acetylase [Actinokineospora globicatena]GLW81789.1 hypothetical protein Aglo01_62700 [Actinokineospora globicatena]GLW88583.1 hypothetical protein Aglo02_62220 [Actinokineospora globicatena]